MSVYYFLHTMPVMWTYVGDTVSRLLSTKVSCENGRDVGVIREWQDVQTTRVRDDDRVRASRCYCLDYAGAVPVDS